MLCRVYGDCRALGWIKPSLQGPHLARQLDINIALMSESVCFEDPFREHHVI